MLKLTKKIINHHLVPHLSKGERGPKCKVGLWRIVRSIVHCVKTGTQWRELPVRGWFGKHTINWNTVYYYHNKWRQPLLCKDGSWQRMWESLLKINKAQLDMSSVQLDGSHTPAWRGGEAVAYQGRKKRKTTNMLFLTDSQGIPLVCSEPAAGNHSDLFEVEKSVAKIIGTLGEAGIEYQGLFLNADAGFDSKKMREFCEGLEISPNIAVNKRNGGDHDYVLDDELYEGRFVIERTNAWLDAFKSLLVRYETKACNWLGQHYLVFAIIFLRRILQTEK